MKPRISTTLLFAVLSFPLWSQTPTPDALIDAVENAAVGTPTWADVLKKLEDASWTIPSTDLDVQWGTLDRATGWQEVTLTSRSKALPFTQTMHFSVAFLQQPTATLAKLAKAATQKALEAEATWALLRTPGGRYEGRLTSARLLIAREGDRTAWVDLNDNNVIDETWDARWSFLPKQRQQVATGPVVETVPVTFKNRKLEVGLTPVTTDLYQAVTKTAPLDRFTTDELVRPTRRVTWLEAVQFCNQLSLIQGRQPVYRLNGPSVLTDFSRNGWRLPTREEWDFFRGNDVATDETSWTRANAKGVLARVATKRPNALGLYDVIGGVRQWLTDATPVSTELHHLAGLGYSDDPSELATYLDWPAWADFRGMETGFRIVRDLNPQGQPYPVLKAEDRATPAALVAAVEKSAGQQTTRWIALEALATTHWLVNPERLTLSVSEFDRDLKQWTFDVESQDPAVPFRGRVAYSIKNVADLPAAFRAFDELIVKKTLRGRLEWALETDGKGRYQGYLVALHLGTGTGSAFQRRVTVPATGSWVFWTSRSTPRVVQAIDDIWVQGGTFTLGQGQRRFRMDWDGRKVEKDTETSATVSDFWMTKTSITQGQYQRVMGRNPSSAQASLSTSERPVDALTWFDVARFANQLSLSQGLQPVYDFEAEWQFLPVNLSAVLPSPRVTVHQDRNGWRLATSAEYEWAARGGLLSRGTAYAGSDDPEKVAFPRAAGLLPVASFDPNELGLFDLTGNGAAWTGDWSAAYPKRPLKDSLGPAVSDQRFPAKVVRGSGVFHPLQTVYDRGETVPSMPNLTVVTRLVRRGPPPTADARPSATPWVDAWKRAAGKADQPAAQDDLESRVYAVPTALIDLKRGPDAANKQATYTVVSRDALVPFRGTVQALSRVEATQARLSYRLKVVDTALVATVVAFELGSEASGVWTTKAGAVWQGDPTLTTGGVAKTPTPTPAAVAEAAPTTTPVWVVNSLGKIFQRTPTGWVVVEGSGKAVLTGADSSVWLVDKGGRAARRADNRWTSPNLEGESVAVGPDGDTWAINSWGFLIHATSDSADVVMTPARFRKVAVGANGAVWALGGTKGPYGWSIYREEGDNWQQVDGQAVELTVDAQGNPWVVNANHQGFRWTPSGWSPLDGEFQTLAAGHSGEVWALGTTESDGGYNILRWNQGGWQQVDGAAVSIAVP